ncbi:MAG: hypothetical protein HY088_05075 [Ignavibacteriales bacterium]|nr:hypothetical protein [Ignavibacteriales bacterium]
MAFQHKILLLFGLLSVGYCGLFALEPADSILYVKRIEVYGNETTKEYIILREMSVKVGDKLTAEALQQDQKRIYSLQLFNKVDVNYTVEDDGATIFVLVYERWYFFPFPVLGFKYSDTDKFFYGAGVMHQNFRGRNEKLFASFALGFDRWVELTYQNPKITDDDDLFFGGSVGLQDVHNLNTDDGFYTQTRFAANTTFGKRFGLYQTVLGSVGYEQWDIDDPRRSRTASSTGKDAFITFGFSYTYDSRDIREYSSSGYSLTLSASKLGVGNSELNMFRYGYDLRGFVPTADGWVFGGRTFGKFVGGGAIPPYLHNYFGYDERIRGYFRTVLEGENSLGTSVELRIPILTPRYFTAVTFLPPEFSVWRYGLYVGIFADAGTTWHRYQPFSDVRWYAGYGVGLQFLLPYSLVVRTEYALNDLRKGEFVLDFGASF